MIIAVDKLRGLVNTDIADEELEARLSAIETAVRKYTNNHFNVRGTEREAEIREGRIVLPFPSFIEGDSIEILSDPYRDKVFTVKSADGDSIEVDKPLRFEGSVRVALVEYPSDVVMGAVDLMRWDISNREKIGIKSESISRWSVTYFDLESSSLLGYPASLLGFAKNHMRARF